MTLQMQGSDGRSQEKHCKRGKEPHGWQNLLLFFCNLIIPREKVLWRHIEKTRWRRENSKHTLQKRVLHPAARETQ